MVHSKKRKRKVQQHLRTYTHIKGRKTVRTRGKVISQRGREHPMAAPAAGMPQQAQNVFMESTAIASYKYKSRSQILRITFQSGHVYDYFDVPAYTVQSLTNAPSKGHYFYYNIRTSFRFRRVK